MSRLHFIPFRAMPVVCTIVAWLGAVSSMTAAAEAGKHFKITIVDQQTGRGVPLVELQTVNAVRYYTDSNGIVAFYEPGLMGRTVFFHIKSHGYEFPKDGFGYRGTKIEVTEGGSVVLRTKRINVAQRLYRVTGAGIYRDSLLTGHPVPSRRPLLNGLVLGQDSVLGAVYGGRIYWFWGDTNRPGYPLGNFHVPGATSLLPADGGLDPDVGVDQEYFLDERGFAKETARMPGEGPTWLDGLVTLTDEDGRQRMFAKYVKVAKPMRIYQRGLVEFDEAKSEFRKLAQFDMDTPLFPGGHPFKHVSDGAEHVYFPLLTRVRATVPDLLDLSRYETYTCLKQGSRADSIELDRHADGRLRYSWKTDTVPLTEELQKKLIDAGRIKPQQGWFRLKDIETGKPVKIHHRSIYFNDYRRRFVMITSESWGSSMLGEIFYAEGDTPVGPWAYGRKIVTHDKYSFYNPKQHPMFDKQGGRVIFFEGTYTHTFSGNPDRTPRYDYNQIMYKLDLADPRLMLPVPVYSLSDGDAGSRFGTLEHLDRTGRRRAIAFFAPDRNRPGTVPVYQHQTGQGGMALRLGAATEPSKDTTTKPLFYALPAETDPRPPLTVPLYESLHRDGTQRAYSIDASWKNPDYRRAERPMCLVWSN